MVSPVAVLIRWLVANNGHSTKPADEPLNTHYNFIQDEAYRWSVVSHYIIIYSLKLPPSNYLCVCEHHLSSVCIREEILLGSLACEEASGHAADWIQASGCKLASCFFTTHRLNYLSL